MMSESGFVRDRKIVRCLRILVLVSCAVLFTLPLAGVGISAGTSGGATAASAVAGGTLLGLDVRDYADNMAAKVPLAERQQIRHYKVVVFWNEVESRDGVFNWDYYDRQISQILADGAESILLLLGWGVPGWAQDPAYGENAAMAPPRDLSKWYRFCGEAAEKYGDLVDFYEV
ncbi:MAG: hypothetical protein PHP28_11950, partial [Actinomycetota bacterium]|nr:hypothetical protein [Actinomycetota bacterium]